MAQRRQTLSVVRRSASSDQCHVDDRQDERDDDAAEHPHPTARASCSPASRRSSPGRGRLSRSSEPPFPEPGSCGRCPSSRQVSSRSSRSRKPSRVPRQGPREKSPRKVRTGETAQHVARVGQQLDMLPPAVESNAVDHPRRLSRPTVDRPQAGRRSELTALSVERGEHTPILRVGEARRMKRRRVVGPPVIEDVCREELGGRLRRHDSETG